MSSPCERQTFLLSHRLDATNLSSLPPQRFRPEGKIPRRLACVSSVSVWFRSKERPRNGFLGFGRARNETTPPRRSFTCAIFGAVFDSRPSFFAPKPHRNACYAGYTQHNIPIRSRLVLIPIKYLLVKLSYSDILKNMPLILSINKTE